MQYAQLADGALRVSRIGFGCWQLGGHGWGPIDSHTATAAVQAALDLGITLFDTADVYGFGTSEERLSYALGARRHEVVIATKFGVRWNAGGAVWRDVSLAWLDEALHASLRRLRLERIPLYQVHWPDGVTPLEAVVERLSRYIESGKVGAVGCCNCTPAEIARVAAAGPIVSLQTAYNAIDRAAETSGVFSACDGARIPVVTHSSLAQGLCSGNYGPASTFAADDVRSRSPYFNGAYAANMAVVARMRVVGDRHGKAPAQVALGWVLRSPRVAAALVGIKSAAQVRENVGALWTMSDAEWHYIADEGDVLAPGPAAAHAGHAQ